MRAGRDRSPPLSVDLSTIRATGKNGRVMKEDVLSHLNISADKSNEVPDVTSSSVQAVTYPLTPAHVKTEMVLDDKTVPVTGFTKAMVKSMTEAMKIPHFGFTDEYDVTKLVECRQILKTIAEEHGVKLTYMPIIIKAASLSLTAFPILNSSLDSTCENLTYKGSHNIGVAMDTPNGLVVPTIKNVQNKSILELARELNALQEKGTKGQLGLNDLTGGTFTISNVGIVSASFNN
ncbi:hypothetical protein evm_013331 [Chilo suppressalis]|nr:hypothetical protein evm_013331 [Chilo suppressalis]